MDHVHLSDDADARVVPSAISGQPRCAPIVRSLERPARANPSWPLERLRSMLRTLLDGTMAQATSRLAGDFSTDARAYDTVETHVLEMSDVLADGIVAQFPDR